MHNIKLILPILMIIGIMVIPLSATQANSEIRNRVVEQIQEMGVPVEIHRTPHRDSSSFQNTGSSYFFWGAGEVLSYCTAPTGHPFITLGDGSVCNAGPAIPSWPFGVMSIEAVCAEASLHDESPNQLHETVNVCERALGPPPLLVQQCDLSVPPCPPSALPTNFIYNTDLHDPSNPSVTLPLKGGVNVRISWGDDADPSCSEVVTSPGDVTCAYNSGGIKEVAVAGDLQRFGVDSDEPFQQKLVEVRDFTQLNGLTSLEGAFRNARNLVSVPNSIPSTVRSLERTFQNAVAFNDPNISNWDISNVVSLASTFNGAYTFNQSLASWNINPAIITSMADMFRGATDFSHLICNWDVAGITEPDRFKDASSLSDANAPGFIGTDWGGNCP